MKKPRHFPGDGAAPRFSSRLSSHSSLGRGHPNENPARNDLPQTCELIVAADSEMPAPMRRAKQKESRQRWRLAKLREGSMKREDDGPDSINKFLTAPTSDPDGSFDNG